MMADNIWVTIYTSILKAFVVGEYIDKRFLSICRRSALFKRHTTHYNKQSRSTNK